MRPATAGVWSPSGQQVEIAYGDQRAVVVEVGGALRCYTSGGRDVLDGYAADEMCSGARGQTLLPWPNRVADGAYRFADRALQLPLTEPEHHNAIHGLVRWTNWSVVERRADRVAMEDVLHPQPGYPFALRLRIDYVLAADGLTVRTTAMNVGTVPCPYGTGAHPYLSVGTPTIDDALLRVPGGVVLPTDGRGIPTGRQRVDATPYDFRSARTLGDTEIDITYTDLERDADGRARVVLAAPGGGPAVTLWVDESYPYLELFTGDALPEADRRRRGLGVEPMTCAPDAFNTGEGLQVLAPTEVTTGTWGITPAGTAATP